MSNKYGKVKTLDPPKVRMGSPVSKPKDTSIKANTEKEIIDVKAKDVKVESNINPVKIPKPLGPKQVWVPKSS